MKQGEEEDRSPLPPRSIGLRDILSPIASLSPGSISPMRMMFRTASLSPNPPVSPMKATEWRKIAQAAVVQAYSLLGGGEAGAVGCSSEPRRALGDADDGNVLSAATLNTELISGDVKLCDLIAPFSPAKPEKLTKEEFVSWANEVFLDKEMAVQMMKFSVAFFDTDNDGWVSGADFATAMRRLGEPVTFVEAIDVVEMGQWKTGNLPGKLKAVLQDAGGRDKRESPRGPPHVAGRAQLGRGRRYGFGGEDRRGVERGLWAQVIAHSLGAQYKEGPGREVPFGKQFSILDAMRRGDDVPPPTPDSPPVVSGANYDYGVAEGCGSTREAASNPLLQVVAALLVANLIMANHRIPLARARGERLFCTRVGMGFIVCTLLCGVLSRTMPESFGTIDMMLVVQCLVLFVAEVLWEGLLSASVVRWDVKINYTRKLAHLLRLPKYFLSDYIPSFNVSPCTLLLSFMFSQALFILTFYRAVRCRWNFAAFLFLSQDRREDRPYTLRFQVTEDLMRYAIYLPFKAGLLDYLTKRTGRDLGAVIFIPIFINTVGDGLAEPVGVKYGRHKYRTRALYYNGKFCSGSFVRSWEGSSMVFLSTVVILCAESSLFTSTQFGVLLCTMPIAMTLAEAVAPHTNDGPFLALVGCSMIAFALLVL